MSWRMSVFGTTGLWNIVVFPDVEHLWDLHCFVSCCNDLVMSSMKSWRFGRASLFHQGGMSGADVDVSKFQLISETDQRLVTGSSDEIVFRTSRPGACFKWWTNRKIDCDRYTLSHCLVTCFNDSIFWHCSKSYPDSYPKKSKLSVFIHWKNDVSVRDELPRILWSVLCIGWCADYFKWWTGYAGMINIIPHG